MARYGDRLDPTRLRNQPALTTSTGQIWLIVGGLFAAISVVVLLAVSGLEPSGVGLFGAMAVAALYAAMVIIRLSTEPGRLRLGLLAACMIAMATIALVCVCVVVYAEWSGG